MHLTPDQFIDVAEGTRTEGSLPHLGGCAACHDELASVRAAMHAATQIDLPDPSPLFWDGFSARVRERIDADAAAQRWWTSWIAPRLLVPLSALAALILVVALVPASQWLNRDAHPQAGSAPRGAPARAGDVESRDAADAASDPLLAMVGDLTANLDLENAADAGFTVQGSADRAVSRMNDDELRTLKRLLQAELARPGA